jgi:hypothetical protein
MIRLSFALDRTTGTELVITEDLHQGAGMSTVLWIILAIIWIALAFWPARVAHRKGHSFIGFFLLSIIFFPLALILAYVVRDRHTMAYGH